MNKAQKIENKLYENWPKNWASQLYAVGENFISWDIAPLKQKSFSNNFSLAVELKGFDICKALDFYCCSSVMMMNGFVRLVFNY